MTSGEEFLLPEGMRPPDDLVIVCADCGADLWPVGEGVTVEHDCATGEVLPA
jgi:hypothetical protein